MNKRIEHIIKFESRVKSFVKGTFDEKRILKDCAKPHSKTNNKLPLKTNEGEIFKSLPIFEPP